MLVAQRDGLNPILLPAGTIADQGLRLPADVRLPTDKATTLLRTRLRGARDFMAAPLQEPMPTRPGADQR